MCSAALVQYTPRFRLVPQTHLCKSCESTRPKCVPREHVLELTQNLIHRLPTTCSHSSLVITFSSLTSHSRKLTPCFLCVRKLPMAITKGRVNSYHVIITNGSPGQRTANINSQDVLSSTHVPTIKPGPVGKPVSCIPSPGGMSGHLSDVISGRLSEAYCILMYALVYTNKKPRECRLMFHVTGAR